MSLSDVFKNTKIDILRTTDPKKIWFGVPASLLMKKFLWIIGYYITVKISHDNFDYFVHDKALSYKLKSSATSHSRPYELSITIEKIITFSFIHNLILNYSRYTDTHHMPSKLAKIIVKIIKNTPFTDVYRDLFLQLTNSTKI